ncbi:transketolase family protein [Paenibacillus sp. YIM B09110]|uniref:transketolase family protein n=1 Tax=Paenibacillus sp. YIM B09110 TaxID=3126102 RepID=UPI00301D296A
MRNKFVETIVKFAETDSNLFLITGDVGFGVLTDFRNQFPDRFINAGISEQNMTSVAAGMAMEGKTVFTYSIANFPTARCFEQIRNDVAYHKANVKIVAVGGGFSYGAQGMSHHATEDMAIMRALPEMTVFAPCDSVETEAVTKYAVGMVGPVYIRLGRGGEKNLHEGGVDVSIDVLKANVLKNGRDTAIFVAGAIANEALDAAVKLELQGVSCAVYSFPSVKPIDSATILEVAAKVDYIFTLEEHNIVGGFGSAVSEMIAESAVKAVVVRMGLNDVYTSAVGSQDYLRAVYGIDANSIFSRVYEKIRN